MKQKRNSRGIQNESIIDLLKIEHSSTLLLVTVSLLVIGLSTIFHYVVGELEPKQMIMVLCSTFVVVFICVYFSLRLSRAKHDEIIEDLIISMKGILKTAQERVVIDNTLLKFIEKDASLIWVVTQTLENDVSDENIIEAVRGNLESGKKEYRYFIPNPDQNPAIRRNKYRYMEKYNEFIDNVRFTYLPENTLFMFDEIVIYNPDQKNFFGYTYINLEGSGKLDQVVRIEQQNVRAIVDSLTKLIEPKRERQERLFRNILILKDRIDLKEEYWEPIVKAIYNEHLSVEDKRQFEDILMKEGLDRNQMQNIQKILNEISQ